MSVLDDSREVARRDPGGALEALATFGEQVRRGAACGYEAAPLPASQPAHVVFCGMGGSGAGGGAAAALAVRRGRVPVVVHRSYGIPAFVRADALVVASSFSGGTEETLDAFRAAVRAGAGGLAVTSGGALASEAERAGWAVARVPAGGMPRYALGAMASAPVAYLERAGVLGGKAAWREELPALLERRVRQWGPRAPVTDNVAKALAHELVGAMPVIWGSEGASGVAALRWRTDLNENAKTFASAGTLPELDHHEVVGWSREGSEGRPAGRRVLVCLREPDEDERIAARFVETTREVADSFDLVWEFTAEGDDDLSRFLDLALLGGFVSCYLAILRGVDPSPVDSISRLKSALAERS